MKIQTFSLLAFLTLVLPCLAACSVPYTPRGVDFDRWESMDEAGRLSFIAELRKKALLIKELGSPGIPMDCRLVGMVHAVGETLPDAKMRALDWAVLLDATHVLWDKTDLSITIAQQVRESGGQMFILGSAYQCTQGTATLSFRPIRTILYPIRSSPKSERYP